MEFGPEQYHEQFSMDKNYQHKQNIDNLLTSALLSPLRQTDAGVRAPGNTFQCHHLSSLNGVTSGQHVIMQNNVDIQRW